MTRAEILNCLTDRPCDSCKFHESGKCERWDCVFEEKPDDAEDCEDKRMTREEAIGIMRVIVHMLEEKYDTDRVEDAVDLAIKALSAEPCREADDYENEIADLQNRLDIAEYDRDRWKEIVTVLEEKLKSLSAEPCEDAISRQAVHNLMAKLLSDYLHDEDREKIENTDAQIADLPSVTPKQKVGHWILDHVVCDVIYEYHCSACGHHLELGGRTIKQDQAEGYSLFCNGCGAKMEESENG